MEACSSSSQIVPKLIWKQTEVPILMSFYFRIIHFKLYFRYVVIDLNNAVVLSFNETFI
jgi:hypothetical protein